MKRMLKRGMSSLTIFGMAGAALMGAAGPAGVAKAAGFSDVPGSHWAYDMVMWSQENGVTSGYPDGTFRPTQAVTESEFLVMLVRAYPEKTVGENKTGGPWYTPYYKVASDAGWPVANQPEQKITRGQVARLMAAVMGQQLAETEAVQLVLDKGLGQGKAGSSGVAGFAPNDALSRAEAQTFLYRLKQQTSSSGDVPAAADKPAKAEAGISLQGVAIGDVESKVVELLGQPARKDVTGHKMAWYIYNSDYKRFAQIGIAEGRVVALYSNAEGWQFEAGDTQGLKGVKSRAEQLWGKAEETKGRTLNYRTEGSYLHLFLDSHEGGSVDGVLVQEKVYFDGVKSGNPTEAVLGATEREVFDLTNAFRVKKGLQPLAWNDKAAVAARLHSQDMAKRNYFEHDSPDGLSAGDRMAAQGLKEYRTWGENIAAGYDDAIEAYNGWINSAGHRANILKSGFTTLGVGMALGSDKSEYHTYFTQNFYTPR
ncbi:MULTISPECIES: CAP domain-containing protein [Paenibacillus]|uniref:CAP domain-containing protein n=1 Tax=Paenibacillus TaxID=44249 RepID=UPI002FE06B50